MATNEYLGTKLTQGALHRRREATRQRQQEAMARVQGLLETQGTLGRDLGAGLETLEGHGRELERMQRSEGDGGLLSALVRPFTARRTALARRSIAEELLRQYEKVSVRLREATAFADELKVTALELQQEVDQLHRELARAQHNQQIAARRVLDMEAALEELESDDHTSDERARLRDRYTFDLRTDAVALRLYEAAAVQCRQHLEPARALRDTVLQLHEDMATYVLSATHKVNASGRRIQGLGMLADAPVVVAELQESLDELNSAMQATADYLQQSQSLIAEVLPELSRRIDADIEASADDLSSGLQALDREANRRAAERALRRAAKDEIDSFLDDGS